MNEHKFYAACLVTCGGLLLAANCLAAAPKPPASVIRIGAPMQIDGDATDWAGVTAGQQIDRGPGRPAAFFRLAYDDNALYGLFLVVDDSPLKNNAAVLEESLKGGDAVGLAFQTGDDRLGQRVIVAQVDGEPVIMALRPKWPVKKPHSFASPVGETKMDYVGPIDGAEAAFIATDGGYVAEVKLPWKSMRIKPSSEFTFDAQVIYSDAGGTTNEENLWWHAVGGQGATNEDLPTEAALYPDEWGVAQLHDKDPGRRVANREAADADSNAEPATDSKDVPITFRLPRDAKVSLVITDDSGFILRELLRAEEFRAGKHTVWWDGRDRYDEVLPPGDYHWKLGHFDGMGVEFLATVGNSGRPAYRTKDGMGSMGGQHGGTSIAVAGRHGVYLMGGVEEGYPAMRAADPEGFTLWTKSMGGFGGATAAALDGDDLYIVRSQKRSDESVLLRLNAKNGDLLKIGNTNRGVQIGDRGFGMDISAAAVADGKLYLVQRKAARLLSYDLKTGQQVGEQKIDSPRALASLDEHTLLISVGNTLQKFDVRSGRMTPMIDSLVEPSAVTTDRRNQIYVAELGDRQQISRYSPSGELLGRIGEPGGRPLTQNPYDPNTLRNVVSLAIDARGKLWVVERSRLRRVATFTVEGEWLTDSFGPSAYNTTGFDLDDLSTVYYQPTAPYPYYATVKVDYDQYRRDPKSPMKAWKVESTFYAAVDDAAPEAEDDKFDGRGKPDRRGRPEDDVADLIRKAMLAGYGHVVSFKSERGHRYLWRLSKFNRASRPPGAVIFRDVDGKWVPAAYVSHDQKISGSWSDANGDGLVQPDELYDAAPTSDFAWMARDLTLWGETGRLAPSKIDANGVPFYDGGKFTPYLPDAKLPDTPSGNVFVSMPDEQGAVYYAANIGPHQKLSFWDRAAENQVIKVADGKVQWRIGHHDPHPTKNVELTTVSGIAGVIDGLLLVHTVEPSYYVAYTTDGLTLGNAIIDPDGSEASGPRRLYIETFTGLLVKDPKTGKKLMISTRSGDDPILEITGPGNLQRVEGTVSLDTAQPRIDTQAKTFTLPYETWHGNAGGREYFIDGLTWEWSPASRHGLPIAEGRQLIGDVRLRRDAGSLFVLANALGDTVEATGRASRQPSDGPVNLDGLFGESRGVELMLAPSNGDTRGATRIFLTVVDGQGVAMQWTGDATGWRQIEDAKVAIVPRWAKLGWRLEAEIPLKALPAPLTQTVPQTFKRLIKNSRNKLQKYTEQRPDLVESVRFNAALHRVEGQGVIRSPWIDDSLPMAQPGYLSSESWGLAQSPEAPQR